MATAHLDTLLEHFHRLTAQQGGCPWTDRQLVDDFAARRDEAAFAALVARHGSMVRGVCRHVLHHEQDAEDAFQATFLVLARHIGSICKRDTVANWLHGVAYRTAMKAKRSAARRRNHEARVRTATPQRTASPTWDEVQSVLDAEIERLPDPYRAAFVLCVLEGKSRPEVAAELGVKEGTVCSRLTRARRLLQQRLTRRGIQLAALLAALSLAESASRASLPTALAHATVRFGLLVAAGEPAAGVIPSHVAALAAGVTRAMFVMKAKILTVLLLMAVALTGAALWAQQAQPVESSENAAARGPRPGGPDRGEGKPPAATAPNKADETFAYKGRVLGSDGKPVVGVKLYLVSQAGSDKAASVRATTGTDGRFEFTAARKEFMPAGAPADLDADVFAYLQVVAVAEGRAPDWTMPGKRPTGELTFRLSPNDVTIDGRALDLQGKAVAGAKIKVVQVETTPEDDLAPFLDAWRSALHEHMALRDLKKVLYDPSLAGLPKTVTTDADGRFRLPGAGKERIVTLSVEAPQIEHATFRVLPRSAGEVKALVRAPSESMMRRGAPPPPLLYGVRFDHLGVPARLIAGTVRDKETGKPMSGVRISGNPAEGLREPHLETYTDKEGRYQLRGLPKAGKYQVYAWPGDFSIYIPGGKEVTGGEGTATATADFEMIRGVEVRGRVTDKVTGKPVTAGVRYVPLAANRHPGAVYYRMVAKNCEGWRIGTFREMVPPGPGVFLVTVRAPRDDNPYTQVRLDPAERTKTGLDEFLLHGVNAYRVIDVAADAKSPTYDIQVDPGCSVSGTVLGPDGKPLTGAMVMGLTALWPAPTPLKTATFTVVALDSREPRQLMFVHLKQKLAGNLVVRGDEKGDVTVQLEPWGTLTGRVLDEDGKPMAGVRIQMGLPHRILFLPVLWWAQPQGVEVKTDRDGRFHAEGLTPGMKFRMSADRNNKFLPLAGTPDGMRELSVGAGETKDLGDLSIKPD